MFCSILSRAWIQRSTTCHYRVEHQCPVAQSHNFVHGNPVVTTRPLVQRRAAASEYPKNKPNDRRHLPAQQPNAHPWRPEINPIRPPLESVHHDFFILPSCVGVPLIDLRRFASPLHLLGCIFLGRVSPVGTSLEFPSTQQSAGGLA